MDLYTFDCGCSFPAHPDKTSKTFPKTSLPSIEFSIENINNKCERTWDMICEGRTKGVFQLESNLGKSWAKRLKPRNIEELAALCALIRPGCLKAIVGGKSMTQHYVDRKHGREKVEYLDPCLEPILKPTQGVLVYQEQSMKIAQVVAGFDLQQADDLRKAIGKKKADLMEKVKKSFLEGASSKGIVTNEVAEEIFSWIEKSNRYAFNKSHAISYAIDGYWSAYAKSHFPHNFFCSYLYHADGKQDSQQEIKDLIGECKLFDIEVQQPDISDLSKRFDIRDKTIYFGINNLKSVGEKQADKICEAVKLAESALGKKAGEFSWVDCLITVIDKINNTSAKAIISSGVLSSIAKGVSRNRMLYEAEIWKKLTTKEKEWICDRVENFDSLEEALIKLKPTKKEGGGTHNHKRKEIIEGEIYHLQNPPYDLSDDPEWVAMEEEKILGCPITYSKVDSCDTSSTNSTCKEIFNGKRGASIIAVSINRINNYKIKRGKSKGQNMAFLSVEDSTCELDDVIIFPEALEKNKDLLYQDNTVLLSGSVEKKDDAFIIKKVSQI